MLVAALAMKFRAMAKVSIGGAASALKMAPWQVDRARRELRGWSDASLAGAFGAIATADAETKGASRDPQRAIEKAITHHLQAARALKAAPASSIGRP